MTSEPVSIFLAYSRKDKPLREEFDKHLSSLVRRKLVRSWHDGCIIAGQDWEQEIQTNLAQAQVVLLLISADFIASDYCNQELADAIERHHEGNVRVIAVILRACDWEDLPVGDMHLGQLQVLPDDAKPVTDWNNLDAAFTSVVRGIRKTIQQLRQEQEQVAYAAKLKTYEQEFARAVQAEYPLSLQVIDELKSVQQRLGLTDEAIRPIEQPIREPAEAKYQQALAEAERQRQEAEAALRRQRAQEEAEGKRREAEAQRQREETELQRKRDEYYNGGIYHLNQGNLDQAIADLTQAKQLGHPQAAQKLAEAQQQKQATEDDLSSEKGIDYTRLRDLLKAQDWQAADQETYEVMIRAVGKQSGNWFISDELLNFPCADLLTIDQLWVKYSQGRFGFSVQKQIYVECGGKLDGKYPGDTIWRKFGDKVGWRVNGSWIYYRDVTFSTSAPQGHLPFGGELGWWGVSRRYASVRGWALFVSLFSRIQTCKV